MMCDPNTLFIIYALLVIERLIHRDVGIDSRFARVRDVQSINSTHVYIFLTQNTIKGI